MITYKGQIYLLKYHIEGYRQQFSEAGFLFISCKIHMFWYHV